VKKNIGVLFLAFLVSLLLGCSGGGKKSGGKKSGAASGSTPASTGGSAEANGGGESAAGGEEAGGGEAYPADKGVATVSGTIKFEGKKRKPRKVDVSADVKCAELHKDAPLFSETVVLGENNELANVIVYVSKGLEKYSFDAPTEPVVLDQKGCHYVPHVLAVMVGQKVTIKNDDPTLHNVHAMPEVNEGFNASQKQGDTKDVSFESAEIFGVKCDVHPWMGSRIGVFEHPFFAVSGKDGKYEIAKLKLLPGKYTLTAVHEKYGEQTQEIEVKDGDTSVTADFTFKK